MAGISSSSDVSAEERAALGTAALEARTVSCLFGPASAVLGPSVLGGCDAVGMDAGDVSPERLVPADVSARDAVATGLAAFADVSTEGADAAVETPCVAAADVSAAGQGIPSSGASIMVAGRDSRFSAHNHVPDVDCFQTPPKRP